MTRSVSPHVAHGTFSVTDSVLSLASNLVRGTFRLRFGIVGHFADASLIEPETCVAAPLMRSLSMEGFFHCCVCQPTSAKYC